MATQTTRLIVELLDRVSGPARGVANSLRGITRTVRHATGGAITLADRLDAAMSRNNRAIDAARGRMLDAVGTLYVLKTALNAPVASAQELERALAELGAKGNFSAAQLKEIGSTAKATSVQVNQSTTDIIRAQDFLVGMGLDVERSTKAMPSIGRAATATGASLEDLSKAGFAAMSNLGIAAQDLARSFDIMAAAGKAGGFELKDMAQYLPSITALASSKGMTGQQGLSEIAAALQIVRRGAGDSAEAATNFNNILQKINSNDAIKNFAKQGIDIQRVLKDAAAKGADPLEAALRAIDKAIKGDMSRLGEIFADAQVQKGLLPLLTGLDDYIRLRDEAAKASGVVDKDFVRMMETGVEKMKAFQISMQNLQASIGNALIPVLGNAAGALRPLLQGLISIVDAHPRIAGALVAITAGFIGLKAAMSGFSYLGLMGKGGLLAGLSFVMNTLGGSLMRLKDGATGMIALQTALAGMEGLKMTGLQTAAAGFRGMALAVPGLSGLAAAMTAVGGALAAVSAPVWGGLALAIAAVAAAAFSLWTYWDRISAFIGGFASALITELQPAFAALEPVLRPLVSLARAIGDGFSWAHQKLQEFSAWIGSFFAREVLSESQKQQYAKAGADLANAMITAITSAFDGLLAWFASLPSRIIAAIGRIDISGLIQWPSLPSWVGGGSAAPAVSATPDALLANANTPPGRARGGPVSRGATYLVGEQGPELITAGRSGYVNRAGSIPAEGITVSPVFNMTFNGRTDAEDVVQQIRRVLRDEVRETFRGVYADAGLRFA
jgi:TP901 family phage tail tape measure protein